jgi:hypothetical protein
LRSLCCRRQSFWEARPSSRTESSEPAFTQSNRPIRASRPRRAAAFVQTKRKLLDDCDLWCIVSLPPGVFSSAGAGVKTNLEPDDQGEADRRQHRRLEIEDQRRASCRPAAGGGVAAIADLRRLLAT